MAISLRRLLLCCVTVWLSSLAAAASGRGIGSGKRNGEEERRREADRVTELPGQPPEAAFRQYSGYVELGPQSHKALFYWFFEAKDEVSERPLVLWLNGGPGCSSVAYGAAQELGPLLVHENGTRLTLNKYSWNRAANILFVESPVGVGFSYTNHSEDLGALGDRVTASDSYAFLLGWFKRFPAFKSHKFYIAGESYAGHYVPQLAELIYEKNKNASKGSFINLKGFMIGNAVLNDATDLAGLVDFAWTHAIIPDELYGDIGRECDGFKSENETDRCSKLLGDVMRAYSDIDIYSIYTPVCLLPSDSARRASLRNFPLPSRLTKHDLRDTLPSGYDPCTEAYVENYFNREDVQKALHANITKLPYPYSTCSSLIQTWNDAPDTVLPIIRKLLKAGLRIWVFSGDTDGRVPVTSTKYSINELKAGVKEKWRAWFHGSQVGGWVVEYDTGLTFATVRGAGHQVPTFRPPQALALFSHFLSGSSLPSSAF